MSLLSNDPLTQLAFSIHENKGVYAILVGSRLSRSADIPTGWEITLDLVRRVALAQGVEDQSDWAAWYKEKTGNEPNYSELVGELGLSRDERRSILHSYIEPDSEDREEDRKLPTEAHHAIAKLVRTGYIKVIVTTNFDRLLENALREQGVEPTVVSSVDALKGAEPLTHTTCYILKLHGDYKDARILNTDEELTSYPEEYDLLLDRIFDEHGLIICGWSGEWDHALRNAILRTTARRYPLFWAARNGKLGDGASELADHRAGQVINISEANEFFASLDQRVETLARTRKQNPLSVELMVNSAKRYLAKPEYRIQLEELVSHEAEALIHKLDSEELSANGSWSKEEFQRRVEIYQSFSESIACVAGVMGRWGDGAELRLVIDVIKGLLAHAEHERGGLTAFLSIRSYPAVLVMTAYGLGLVRAQRWATLHDLLSTHIHNQNIESTVRMVEQLFLWAWPGGNNDYWKSLDGFERHKTPLSDHLFNLFASWGKPFLGMMTEHERNYEMWEILCSLAHIEKAEKAKLESALEQQGQDSFVWHPVGRSGWNGGMRTRILDDVMSDSLKPNLLSAGFGHGDQDYLEKAIANYNRLAGRMSWR